MHFCSTLNSMLRAGVSFGAFTLSSAAAIVPWTVTLVYFGSLAKSMADIFNGASLPEGATQYFIFIASGLTMVVTAAYTTIFSRCCLSLSLHATSASAALIGVCSVYV